MKEKLRKYSVSQKVLIVRELLDSGYSVSDISEKLHVQPTQLMRWKKQLFEGAHDTFSQKSINREQRHER